VKIYILFIERFNMGILSLNKIFCSFLLLCAAACILQPVMADNGTITIAYRGSGGGYIGETVVFDGRNSYGNMTLLTITGPGLPSGGVPVNNLNDPSGTGTPAGVDQYGAWKFVWYASNVQGIEKLTTGRYTFTATDSKDRTRSATSPYMLKKPEYSISASPNPVNPGHYVELIGTAEKGITTAKIEIKDGSGSVLHSYTSPVSSSGYFSYGLHVDMNPGQYQVTVSNPELKAPFGTVLSVIAENGTLPATTPTTPATREPVSVIPTVEVTHVITAVPVSSTIPAKSPVSPLTILVALVAGIGVLGISRCS
jgi:hypothetical protein